MKTEEEYNILITDEDGGVKNVSFNYLLGFQPSLGAMILTENSVSILLDGRYFGNREKIDEYIISQRLGKQVDINYILLQGNIVEAIVNTIGSSTAHIALENSLTYKYIEKFQKLSENIQIGEPYFLQQRVIKQDDEIKNIKQAIKIIGQVYREIETLNKNGNIIGKTEIEIRQFIISKIFEFGGTGESFPAIVAYGKHSAIPHHEAGDTIIETGVLLIDMGALYKGYCSDFTRTFWVGEKLGEQYKKFIKIHDIVQTAHDNAIAGIKVGNTTNSVDWVARDYITKAGYGELFIHSTGHGVGLDIHEIPGVSSKSQDTIKKGMVFTVEPGIYIPGEFGIRVEDIVII